jgi:hypothetical protein
MIEYETDDDGKVEIDYLFYQLKPCPFCKRKKIAVYEHITKCLNDECNFFGPPNDPHETYRHTIDKWNYIKRY